MARSPSGACVCKPFMSFRLDQLVRMKRSILGIIQSLSLYVWMGYRYQVDLKFALVFKEPTTVCLWIKSEVVCISWVQCQLLGKEEWDGALCDVLVSVNTAGVYVSTDKDTDLPLCWSVRLAIGTCACVCMCTSWEYILHPTTAT